MKKNIRNYTQEMEEQCMTIEEVMCFKNIVDSYSDVEYLLSTIMCSAAPTLAGEKVSTLLNFSNSNHNLQDTWKVNKELIKDLFHIDFYELKEEISYTVVLFYIKEKLQEVLKEEKYIRLLEKYGYKKEMNIRENLIHLSHRFKDGCPHEVGVFLGYPIDDIEIYINRPGEKCKLVGYWKVYKNVEEARETFSKYDETKYKAMRLIMDGVKPMDIIEMCYSLDYV